MSLYISLSEIKVFQEGETRIQPFYDFEKAGLHPVMRRNVDLAGYKVPTPIQMYCLPAIIHGHDVMGIAQTGMFIIVVIIIVFALYRLIN